MIRNCTPPAASRASKTHFSGLGPPWRSHPCIAGYPQCHRVRAVGMERSDRQHQPIDDTQSRFNVYVTGLLPAEPPKRIFRVWGRHGGPILVLRATHSATWCVPWVWNDQTGNTKTDCRYAESIHHMCYTGLLPAEPPKRIFRVWGRHGGPILVVRATHSATGCVPWVWNDQTGNTNRLPIRRVDSPHMSHRPAASRASKTHFSGLGPPWRSHPCIEGYPQCHWVRAVGMERSDRQHQPIADTQSRFTIYICVTPAWQLRPGLQMLINIC